VGIRHGESNFLGQPLALLICSCNDVFCTIVELVHSKSSPYWHERQKVVPEPKVASWVRGQAFFGLEGFRWLVFASEGCPCLIAKSALYYYGRPTPSRSKFAMARRVAVEH
jgi:hypothetical protein